MGLFILGAGRSGTSLAAGLFRHCGLYAGTQHYLPRASNPEGFFEDREINAINEAILAPLLPPRPADPAACGQDSPGEGQRWLARLPLHSPLALPPGLEARIRAQLQHGPFCFKDPRFCYTLGLWRRCLSAEQQALLRCVCVYRDPAVVAASVLREVHSVPYLASLAISVDQVLANWCLLYRHVLEHHARSGRWLFVRYDDLFTPAGLDQLAAFTALEPDRQLPRPELNRSRPLSHPLPQECRMVLEALDRRRQAGALVEVPA